MSFNYKEVTLTDISIDGKGSYGISASAVDYSEDLYTYLRITDIKDDGNLIKEGLKSVSDEKAEKYILKPNDIVFARTGNSTGRSYFYDGRDGELVYAGFLIKFSLDPKKVNPKFIRYYTLSEDYKNWVSSFSTGSTRGNINAKTYGNMKIKLPDRKQQDFLVQILSDLDEKIEINNKINDNLEKIAHAIFKQWFVDFEFPNENGEPYKSSGGEMIESELGEIPKGWEVSTLGNLCDISSSKRIFMKEYVDYGIPFFRSKEIIEKSKGNSITTEIFISRDKYEEIKTKFGVPFKNDILLTSVGTLGIPYLVDEEEFYFKDGNLTWLKDFKKYFNYYIYYFLISNIGKKSIDEITIGSTQKAITISSLKQIKIIKPTNEIIEKYDKVTGSIIKQIKINIKEKQQLIKLRDTLLPKLMSGEIRVPLD